MKAFLHLAILSILIANISQAQEAQDLTKGYQFQKDYAYKTWISNNQDQSKLKGFLYEKNDSSIIIREGFKNFKDINPQEFTYDDMMNLPLEYSSIPFSNIDVMKARRKGRVGRGVFIGALTGLAIGGLIGVISGDDPPDTYMALTAGEKALMLGMPMAAIGAGVGGLLGSFKVTIPLN
jgi:hypothetical protein